MPDISFFISCTVHCSLNQENIGFWNVIKTWSHCTNNECALVFEEKLWWLGKLLKMIVRRHEPEAEVWQLTIWFQDLHSSSRSAAAIRPTQSENLQTENYLVGDTVSRVAALGHWPGAESSDPRSQTFCVLLLWHGWVGWVWVACRVTSYIRSAWKLTEGIPQL